MPNSRKNTNMKPSQILRPTLPKGYVDHPISEVAWEHVEERLISIHKLLDLVPFVQMDIRT